VKFGLSDWLSETTLLFDISLFLDRTLAQRKAKSKVKVTQCAARAMMFFLHMNMSTMSSC